MDLISLLTAAFELHRMQVTAFETSLRRDSYLVEPEIPLPREDVWRHGRIEIADFIVVRKIETGHERIEHSPERVLDHAPAAFARAGITVEIETLVWDRVLIETGGTMIAAETLDSVLRRWHWDQDADALPDAPGYIHAIEMTTQGLHVDFGSAPPEALLEVVDVLGAAGIDPVRILLSERPR